MLITHKLKLSLNKDSNRNGLNQFKTEEIKLKNNIVKGVKVVK